MRTPDDAGLRFSVVVCAYNESRRLAECLRSVAEQRYDPRAFEILIIDDASTDATPEIAREFVESTGPDGPRAVALRVEHGGLSIARNTGVRLAAGALVAFIDGDAVADPDWLSELDKAFMAGADYVGGRIELLNGESAVARFAQLTRHRQSFGPRVWANSFVGCNMAFRSSVFDEFGGFYENLFRGEESVLAFRLKGVRTYGSAPEAVVYHDRPDEVWAAVRVDWRSLRVRGSVERALAFEPGWRRWGSLLEQLSIAALPVLAVLAAWVPAASPWFTAAGVLASRRLVWGRAAREMARDLVSHYGLWRGLVGHAFYVWLYAAVASSARIAGLLGSRDFTPMPPQTAEPRVERWHSSDGVEPRLRARWRVAARSPLRSCTILGARVDPLSIDELNDAVAEAVELDAQYVIANHNLHSLSLFQRDLRMRALYARAHCIHVDGMGVVALGRLLGEPLRPAHRVTYLDWIGPLIDRAERSGWRVFLLGGLPGVAERAAAQLRRRNPGVDLKTAHGWFDTSPGSRANTQLIEKIAEARPHVLLVGMGMPRQEHWTLANLDQLEANAILMAGGCLDYLAGETRTPPRWLSRAGFEWAYRLLFEPRRLWRRYLVEPWSLLSLAVRELREKR